MSISIADIRTSDVPKRGTIKPGVEAELTLGAFKTNLEISALPEHRHAYVAGEIIRRLYDDIAQDFENMLTAKDPDTAARLRDLIRTKLRGEGTGLQRHKAPEVTHVTRD